MDWNAAIEKNREALKRVLAMLVAMAGLAGCPDFTSPLWGGRREASGGGCGAENTPTRRSDDRRPPHKGEVKFRPTLPRHLHRAVLRLLRPAEAAVRRLVIVAARGLVVNLPPARPRKPGPQPAILRNGIGTGILMPRGISGPPPLTPPHKGEGGVLAAQDQAANSSSANAAESPSPLWGGVRGGGRSGRHPAFQLFDPLPRWNVRVRPAAGGVPRISVPGYTEPFPIRLPSRDDAIDATRLALRLEALASALDDLPGQARRFARWRIRRDAAGAQNKQSRDAAGAQDRNHDTTGTQARQDRRPCRTRRIWPLRPGRPPGFRQRPVHEVHEVLNIVHGLAFWALTSPDTS